MAELVYEISFKGAASDALAGAFEGCTVRARRGVTVLRTGRVDQASLHGLIDRVGDLGLVLLDVRLVAEADGSDWWAIEC